MDTKCRAKLLFVQFGTNISQGRVFFGTCGTLPYLPTYLSLKDPVGSLVVAETFSLMRLRRVFVTLSMGGKEGEA